MDELRYREMRSDEAEAVSSLVWRVFSEFEGPEYTREGVEEFERYILPTALRERSVGDHFVLVCAAAGELVGAIEVRGGRHLSLLFVDRRFHRRGVAKELWRRALARCQALRPELARVTVNSSPYAVPVYERLGFRATDGEQVKNGIRFVPMAVELGAPKSPTEGDR